MMPVSLHPPPGWPRVLDAFPTPVAVLDAEGRYTYLNRTSRTDPVLARGRPGETPLACCRFDAPLLTRAQRRHARYLQAVQTGRPAFAVEAPPASGRDVLWVFLPVADVRGAVSEVVVMGLDVPEETPVDLVLPRAGGAAGPEDGTDVSVGAFVDELRTPLTAIVSLARSLSNRLSGTPGEQAALIEQGGRWLLNRLEGLKDHLATGVPDTGPE